MGGWLSLGASVPLSSACRGESRRERGALQHAAVLDVQSRRVTKCGAGGIVCTTASPAWGGGGGWGGDLFPTLSSNRDGGPGVGFQKAEGVFLGSGGEAEENLFGIQQETRSPRRTCSSPSA